MCYFLHQSESKEIDEMKRIAVVVMRKDRELVVEEDHHIPLSPDRQQSKRNGPYDLITSFTKLRSYTMVLHMHTFALFKIFSKIKNANTTG